MSNLDDLKKQVEALTNQISSLEKQLANANGQMKGLLAQAKASQQLCGELTNANIILRTNLILQQEHAAKLNGVIKSMEPATQPTSTPVKDNKAA